MNYAHNNLQLKNIQYRARQVLNLVSTVWNTLKPHKKTVELEVISDKNLPALPDKR